MPRHELNENDYILEARNLCKHYTLAKSRLTVLEKLSLCLRSGEIGMLMGPSGCGKTTLLMILGGILQPDHGYCKIYGQDVFGLTQNDKVEFRRRHISFIFQHLHLFPALSALENVALPLLIDNIPTEKAFWQAREMMVRLGLEMHLNSKLELLSGGQKQRIAMGRALIREPKLILCDEPTSNLDEESANLVFSLIETYRMKGCTFIISTHDYRVIHHATQLLTFKGLNHYQLSMPKSKSPLSGDFCN